MARKITRRNFLKNAVVGGVALGTGLGAYKVTYGQAKKAAGPIKIGGQGAISGAHADYGWQMMAGATLAIEQINAKGGILGRKLELKFMDEELKPATAVKNARYLATEWGADFLFGIDSSGSAMAVGPVLPELNRLCFVTHGATHRLTEELVYQKGIKQIFRMVAPVYQDALAAWAPFWTMDFSSHLSAVMAEKPDAIFATPWAGEGVMLLRQALMLGVFDKIQVWWQGMGGSVDVLEGLSREIEADKFKGKLWGTARYIHNWPATPENKAFVEAFRKRWARFPNYSAEGSYSSIYAIKAGAEKAKSIETLKVAAALEGMELKTPGGLRLVRKEDHQAVYTVPAGRAMKSPDYTIPILGDLKVIQAKDYFRHPPFTPVAATK